MVLILAIILVILICATILVILWKNKSGPADKASSVKSSESVKTELDYEGEQGPAKTIISDSEKIIPIVIGKGQTIGSRQEQQDSFLVTDGGKYEKGILVAVADGVGGVKGGAIASNEAVSALRASFTSAEPETDPADDLLKAAVAAHEAVLSKEKQGYGGYSTLVSILIRDDKLWLLSIGDSRIALYRSGLLLQLNREHVSARSLMEKEFVQHEHITEEQKKGKNRLSSYLGISNLQQIDRTLQPMLLCSGDKIILMSDGVFNTLSDDILCMHLRQSPKEAADSIIRQINDARLKGQDNATIIIVEVQEV